MRKINWNTDWTFLLGNSWRPKKKQIVDLPHDFIINLPRKEENAGGGRVGYTGSDSAVYEKTLYISEEEKEGVVFLEFDGIYEHGEIYVNDDLILMHPYGYTGVFADLTAALGPGENRIRVVCSSFQPASRWYTGGGIYRGVTLYKGGKVYIHPQEFFVTTPYIEKERATVDIRAEINSCSEDNPEAMIFIEIRDGKKAVARTEHLQQLRKGKNAVRMSCTVEAPQLWDVEHPHLYQCVICVQYTESGCVRQEIYEQSFGIRRIEIDAKRGLRLNGRPMKLRGGCIHHDNGMLGAAAFARAEERKIQLLKDAGFNAVRTAHNPPSSALLDACDRLGMLVLAESFDCWRLGKNPLDYHLSFEKWWEFDTCAMVVNARNHPSVYCWSIGNEIMEFGGNSDGAAVGKMQADLIRKLDPTRPVTSGINCACGRPGDFFEGMDFPEMNEYVNHVENGVFHGEDLFGKVTEAGIANLDIAGYNYHFRRYAMDREKYPDRIIQGTESRPALTWDNWQAVCENPNVIGDFVWVAMDNLGEAGMGQVTWSREIPKSLGFPGWPWLSCWQGDLDMCGNRLPISYYRNVVWGTDRGIHVFTRHPSKTGYEPYGNGWHWEEVFPSWTYGNEWIGKPVYVTAYADAQIVEFYVNGVCKARVKPQKRIAHCELVYEPGELKAVALRDDQAAAEDICRTAGAAARLELRADRSVIAADGQDLSYIRAQVVDKDGIPIIEDEREIIVSVSRGGILQGLGSGNPCTKEDFGTGRRKAFRGSITAVIRSDIRNASSGETEVSFEAACLPAAVIKIETRK